jgi:hypothetical protein
MDKKVTTALGIALGASLVAGAGFGIYKFIKSKYGNKADNSSVSASDGHKSNLFGGYIGNGLIKSNSLYGGQSTGNDLIGGGLYKGTSLAI